MNPGELRHRIIIQKQITTQDTFGEQYEEWDNITTVWANINPISGREFFAAESVNSEITHKVRLRYREDIKPDMRVSYKGRIFRVESVINEFEKDKLLQLMCKELI